MKKIIYITATLFMFFFASSAFAAQQDNVFGYAWSHNTGWISMNNCTESGGVVSCPAGPEYGITIDPTTGAVSGYAWSSNLGWIDFGDAGSCGPDAQVTWGVGGTGVWSGYVRAISADANSGGWDGCIRMAGTGGGGYQVSIAANGQLTGYGWNANNAVGRTVGDSWINFSLAYYKLPTATLELVLDSNWSNSCSASNPVTLSWTSAGVVPNSCDFSGGAVTAQNQPANGTGVNFTVPQAPNINITITCDTVAGGTITDTVGPLSCSQCSDGIDNADADSDIDEDDSACMSCPPDPANPDPGFVPSYLPSLNSESGSCVGQIVGPRTTPIYEER